MKHVYNEKISRKANECLRRREHKVAVQKRVIALIAILILSFLVVLGSSIRAFANSREHQVMHKYYTSVRVEQGDTLWNIADRYTMNGVYDRDDFIAETCELNHLTDRDQLHSGDYIVVGYYSSEIK